MNVWIPLLIVALGWAGQLVWALGRQTARDADNDKRQAAAEKQAEVRQTEIIGRMEVLTDRVGELQVTAARNSEQHDATDQRIERIEEQIERHDEGIQRLRSAYHNMAGTLQRKDPSWRPYDLDK